jgi:hypothetical protein
MQTSECKQFGSEQTAEGKQFVSTQTSECYQFGSGQTEEGKQFSPIQTSACKQLGSRQQQKPSCWFSVEDRKDALLASGSHQREVYRLYNFCVKIF